MNLDEILLAGAFFIGGIIVTIVGSLIADRKNHKRRIEYLKESMFFKKKIEYFEKILEEVGNMCYNYSTLISYSPKALDIYLTLYDIKKENIKKNFIKKEIQKISQEVLNKEKLNSFLPKGNSLYLDDNENNKKIQAFILNHSIIAVELKKILAKKEDISDNLINLLQNNLQMAEQIRVNLQKEIKSSKIK